jgi:hypothetical protein
LNSQEQPIFSAQNKWTIPLDRLNNGIRSGFGEFERLIGRPGEFIGLKTSVLIETPSRE